jgi:hypothetical protein
MHTDHLKARILGVLIVAWLAIQVAVPTVALFHDRPARLGWQMYTAVTDLPVVTLRETDGSTHSIDVRALVARDRAEADFTTAIADALCRREAVAAVIVEHTGTRSERPCHQ